MEITVKSPYVNISNHLQQQIIRKFKHVGKQYQRAITCDITVLKENNDAQRTHCIEAKLLVPGDVLFCKESAETFEGALNKASMAMKHQLEKHKEKFEKVN